AAADLVVSSDTFIEDGLGIVPVALDDLGTPAEVPPPPPSPHELVLEAMAQKVYETVLAESELPATGLVFIFKSFSEFTASDNWLGFSSLRYLTLELIRRRPALRMVDGDPWRVVLAATADALAATVDASVEVPTIETDETAPPPIEAQAETDAVNAQLREQIIGRVRQFVSNSLEPVDMARAAFDVIRTFGPQVTETEWAGTGSFKQLLQGAAPLDFEIVTAPNQPGYLYDPARHAPPFAADATVTPLPDKLDRLAPALAGFVPR